MVNPLEVEQRYRDAAALCSGHTSPVRCLFLLDHFLQFLGEDAQAFQSYLLDVAQIYQAVIRTLPVAGHDPLDLGRIGERLASLESWVDDAGTKVTVQQTLEGFRFIQAAAHAFVGDEGGMLRVLGERRSITTVPADSTPFERMRLLYTERDRLGFQTAVRLEQLFKQWETYSHGRSARALIPVIDRLIGTATPHDRIGTLVTADFRVTSTSSESQDDIVANVSELQPGRGAGALASTAAKAARTFLTQTAPHIAQRHVAGRITFLPPHLLHEGSSADLAMAALIYAGILAYTNQRVTYAFRPAVAFTGGILLTGAITAVDQPTLAVKVRTVFFSPAEVLVVPRTQLDAARHTITTLHAQYPARTLEVVGVDRLRDVFSDLRIIRRVEHSRTDHAVRWLWRRRGIAAFVAALVVLLSTIALFISPPLDKRPASASYEGEVLVVRNRDHAVIAEVTVGLGTVAYMTRKTLEGSDVRLHSFVDVNGDGSDDLVYGIRSAASTGSTSHVRAQALNSWTVFWDVPVTDTTSFSGSPDAAEGGYSLSSIVVGSSDTPGAPGLFLTANNMFFPALLRRLDLRTGATLATYVHVGHIASALYAKDLDDDGLPELLCCGINSAYRKPFLAIFDTRCIGGHSPAQGAYTPDGLGPGLEKYYLLLPETVIGAAYHFKRKSSSVLRMEFRSDQRSFAVHLDDVAGVIDDNGRDLTASYYLYFDRFLKPTGVSTGESYDILAARLLEEGKIRTIPDKTYFEEYMRGIQYWDGDGWVNTPTINRHYLEAVQRSGLQPGVRRKPAPRPR
jgi:hypothetical protein